MLRDWRTFAVRALKEMTTHTFMAIVYSYIDFLFHIN